MLMHMLTKGRNLKHWLGPDDVDKITQAMLKCASTCPIEFSRRPIRTLKELDRFKTTEFRMLLCYVGVVLKCVLTWKKCSNFLLLACASRIMLTSDTTQSHNLLAQWLANAFMESHHADLWWKVWQKMLPPAPTNSSSRVVFFWFSVGSGFSPSSSVLLSSIPNRSGWLQNAQDFAYTCT